MFFFWKKNLFTVMCQVHSVSEAVKYTLCQASYAVVSTQILQLRLFLFTKTTKTARVPRPPGRCWRMWVCLLVCIKFPYIRKLIELYSVFIVRMLQLARVGKEESKAKCPRTCRKEANASERAIGSVVYRSQQQNNGVQWSGQLCVILKEIRCWWDKGHSTATRL